jgi:hypothetical protein
MKVDVLRRPAQMGSRRSWLLAAFLVCLSALNSNPAPAAQPKGPDTREVRAEIGQYYRDMSCKDGQLLPAFQTHFWSGATITTIWPPSGQDKPQVLVIPVQDFVRQASAGPCSRPVFEEKMENAEVKIHNGLAQVWARYSARFGKPASLDEWSGIDAFTLLKHDGQWKIVSLVFRADSGGPH